MPTGTVKWFNNAKGYGFILPEGGGDDLFVHYSQIDSDGYRTLKAGQAVEYETHEGEKGFHATHVRRREPAADSVHPPRRTGERQSPATALAAPGPSGDSVAAAMLEAARED